MKQVVLVEVTLEATHLIAMVEVVQVHIIQEINKKILQDIITVMEVWK